jgi:3-hydroxybutyryl-CoA dehydrogenase
VDLERPVIDEGEQRRTAGDAAPEILGRLSAQIVNEACFALGDEVASRADIDTAMRLGFNWPLGPIEWGERLGFARAVAVLARHDDEVHRPAPLLAELAAGGRVPS